MLQGHVSVLRVRDVKLFEKKYPTKLTHHINYIIRSHKKVINQIEFMIIYIRI